MVAARPVHIFVCLQEVLRPAAGNAAARRRRQVTGETEKLAECRKQTLIGEIQSRRQRILAERQVAIAQTVEDYLGLRNHRRGERMSDAAKVVLITSR